MNLSEGEGAVARHRTSFYFRIDTYTFMADRFPLSTEAKYTLLLEIAQKLRDTLDLDEILNHLLDTIQVFVDYDAAGVFVLNQVLVHDLTSSRGVIAGIVRRFYAAPPQLKTPC
jgi:hypothetical protein